MLPIALRLSVPCLATLLLVGAAADQQPARPADDHADQYGHAPGREFPQDVGWIAHTGGGSGYPFTHSTEYETFPDFFRITIGWGSRYHRSFMPNLQGYPGLARPGRIVLRARRDTTAGELKFFFVHDDSQWLIRVVGGLIKPVEGEPAAWPEENWTTWHNYIFDNDGENVTFSIDEDPKLTVVVPRQRAEAKNPGQAYVSIGHSWIEDAMRYYDVQALHFLEPGQAVPAPPEAPRMNGPYVTRYANGQTRTEGTYIDGVPVGRFTSYYANGQRESEGTFDEQGRKQGTWRYWHPGGEKRKEVTFADDLYHGALHCWPLPASQIDPADARLDRVARALADPKGFTQFFEHGKQRPGTARQEWTAEPSPRPGATPDSP